MDDLLRAPLESVTDAAAAMGLRPGVAGAEAGGILLAAAEADGRAQVALPTAADGQHRAIDE